MPREVIKSAYFFKVFFAHPLAASNRFQGQIRSRAIFAPLIHTRKKRELGKQDLLHKPKGLYLFWHFWQHVCSSNFCSLIWAIFNNFHKDRTEPVLYWIVNSEKGNSTTHYRLSFLCIFANFSKQNFWIFEKVNHQNKRRWQKLRGWKSDRYELVLMMCDTLKTKCIRPKTRTQIKLSSA